jgi:hypothetical protein
MLVKDLVKRKDAFASPQEILWICGSIIFHQPLQSRQA